MSVGMVYSTFFCLIFFYATSLVDNSIFWQVINIHLSSLLIYRFLYHFLLALRYRNTTTGNLYVTAIHLQNFGHSVLTHSSLFSIKGRPQLPIYSEAKFTVEALTSGTFLPSIVCSESKTTFSD
jgi:hypothetical protein